MKNKKKETSVFDERLSSVLDEMKWLYMELYRNEQAFDYFCTMLGRMYDSRSESLKQWDEKRIQTPDWYKGNDRVGMMLYVDNFGGDLKGVINHLDYLEECGINYLHLMPLLESPKGKSDGGYAVSDFQKVQEELGTMEDLSLLNETCHEKDIVVCMDFVMNHTSEDHEWAIRAKRGEKEFMDRFFFYDDWSIPFRYEETVPQVFPESAPGNFSWCPEVGKVVMTTFYPYQWDLNYANPTVFNDMTENMLYLCNRGADVIRLDAVPYIWKELGTTCRNLPQVHTLVRLMRLAVEVVCPGTLLLGEVVMAPSEVVPYFGTVEKGECQMLYNVTTMATTWHTVATRDSRLLKRQLGTIFALPREYTYLNYLRCHDDLGWGLDYDFLKQFGIDEVAHKKFLNDYFTGSLYGSDSRGELYNDDPRLGDARLCGTTASLCGIEAAEYERDSAKLEYGIREDLMLHAFLFTQSGIPLLYSGDEIGQLNDYTYHEDEMKKFDSRYIHRGKFSWEDAARRTKRNAREAKIFKGIQKLMKLRRQYDVFSTTADVWLIETHNDKVLGIGRYQNHQKLLAFFNFGDYDETAWVDEPESYKNLMTGKRMAFSNPLIPAHDFLWALTEYKEPDTVSEYEV